MKIFIFVVAVALVMMILVSKAIYTTAMFTDDPFRLGNGKNKEE